ncbi:MAG: glycosyltransferase family 4 protein [Acidimicrobiales bacterium]|nr:glycosyltransferase family 4 protein [Acidimicrobiales bacterium]
MTGAMGARAATRPHVVVLGHGAERTGPPILLGHLLRGLAASHDLRLSVLVARGGPLTDEYRAAGAEVHVVAEGREPLEPLAAGLRRLGAAGVAARLQGAARGRTAARIAAPDLVYVNAATPPTAALLHALAPPATVPVLLHVHELDVGLRDVLDPADRSFLFARADAIVAASDAVADALVNGHGVAPDRITTCPEFVDVAGVSPLPADAARARMAIPVDALVVGAVGLADWRKDPDQLARALHLLAARHGTEAWLVWIGGDPTSPDGLRLAGEARRLGLTDRFVHVPHTERPDRLLGALDVFALPAREDALPLAALEAAAAGLPLVCFRTGGVAGLCDRGAGIAVEYPDLDAFTGAIGALLADPALRREVGDRAAALVRAEHDLTVGVGRIAEVLDHLLGASAP